MHIYDCVRIDPHFTTIRSNGKAMPKRAFQNFFIRLIGMSNYGKRTIYASISTLAEQAKISERSVVTFIAQLASLGYLKIISRGGKKGRFFDCNRYKVLIPSHYKFEHTSQIEQIKEKIPKTPRQIIAIARAVMLKVPGSTEADVYAFLEKCDINEINQIAPH